MDHARLKKIDLFATLSDDELERLARVAHEASMEDGEELVRKGTWSYQLFAIEEGSVEVRRGEEDVAMLEAGDVVGETGVVERALRNATAVARGPVKVIFFTQADVGRLSKSIPNLDDRLAEVLEKRRR